MHPMDMQYRRTKKKLLRILVPETFKSKKSSKLTQSSRAQGRLYWLGSQVKYKPSKCREHLCYTKAQSPSSLHTGSLTRNHIGSVMAHWWRLQDDLRRL